MKQLTITVALTCLVTTTLGLNLDLVQSPLKAPFEMFLDSVKCNLTLTDRDVSKMIYYVDFPNMMKTYSTGDYKEMASDLQIYGGNLEIWFYFGGFNEYFEDPEIQMLRNVMKEKYLAIYCDTSPYTTVKDVNIVTSYQKSVDYLYSIGREVAYLTVYLKNMGIQWERMKYFGQSLSCPTLGHIGQHVINMIGKKVSALHCADHARPCFENVDRKYILDATDAEYVSKIHSNAGELGIENRWATVDFFGDGEGFHAKQCVKYTLNGEITPLCSICSHFFGAIVWMTAVQNPTSLISTKCTSYDDLNAGKCAGNQQSYVGPAASLDASGYFYFKTDDNILEKVIANGILSAFTNKYIPFLQ